MRQRLPTFVAALWWGSLTTLGFLVVPMLFANLPTPADAGRMAAKLFSAQTWVSMGCFMLLLMAARPRDGHVPEAWARGAMPYIVGGGLLALLLEFAVAPHIVTRENLRMWHTVGSAMYLLQWGCAAAVLWKTSAPRGTAD